jgi:hypothetical protein
MREGEDLGFEHIDFEVLIFCAIHQAIGREMTLERRD